jgi:nucleotide-binding universal stress UspA family protein
MSWKTIVVGVDDTEASHRALQKAVELAEAVSGGRLVVTSVAPLLVGMAASRGLGPFDPADPPEQHREELAQAREYLLTRKVPAEFDLEVGDPADQIVALAEKHEADLIVVGTREPGVLERVVGGSVSGAVARKAHCDVLIVH